MLERYLSLGDPQVPETGNRTRVVVGIRRCSKTWWLFWEVARLERSGVDRLPILYFNFDDERLRPYDRLLLSMVMERFYALTPSSREGVYLFLDEI